MYSPVLHLLVFVLVVSVAADPTQPQQCPVTKNSLVKLSINTRRNETGHWQSQIFFNAHGDEGNETRTESWSLDFEQRTTSCEGKRELGIIATITQEPDSNQHEHEKNIPAGYELFPSVGYYKFHSDSVIWAHARQVCAEVGAHLIIVNSEPEANVLRQFFDRYPKEKLPNYDAYDSIWIGVYEQGANGQYFTIFGEPLNSTGFMRWHPSRPAEPGANECLICYRPTVGLYDLDCKRRAPFVCELPK